MNSRISKFENESDLAGFCFCFSTLSDIVRKSFDLISWHGVQTFINLTVFGLMTPPPLASKTNFKRDTFHWSKLDHNPKTWSIHFAIESPWPNPKTLKNCFSQRRETSENVICLHKQNRRNEITHKKYLRAHRKSMNPKPRKSSSSLRSSSNYVCTSTTSLCCNMFLLMYFEGKKEVFLVRFWRTGFFASSSQEILESRSWFPQWMKANVRRLRGKLNLFLPDRRVRKCLGADAQNPPRYL